MEVRIVSFSQWTTQVLLDLDLDNWIAGCSHDSLIPPDAGSIVPVVTQPFDPGAKPKEKFTLTEMLLSKWDVDMEKLRELQPTHLLTEGMLHLSGLTLEEAEEILARDGLKECRLIDLYPLSLKDIFEGIGWISQIFGTEKKGMFLVKTYEQKLKNTSKKYGIRRKSPVIGVLRKWPFLQLAGRWMSDLIGMAGARPLWQGDDLFIYFGTYLEDQPDIFILGDPFLSLKENKKKVSLLDQKKLFFVLACERKPAVLVVDGPVFYDHSLTGLDTALKILGEIIRNDPDLSERKGIYWEEAKVYNA